MRMIKPLMKAMLSFPTNAISKPRTVYKDSPSRASLLMSSSRLDSFDENLYESKQILYTSKVRYQSTDRYQL